MIRARGDLKTNEEIVGVWKTDTTGQRYMRYTLRKGRRRMAA